MKKELSNFNVGDTFVVADIEFIKFGVENESVVAVSKDIVCTSKFGDNTNFAKSEAYTCLRNDILPRIEDAVGSENVLEFTLNLKSTDDPNLYMDMKTKIGLPTYDFYDNHRNTFRFCTDRIWYLSTAKNNDVVRVVMDSGYTHGAFPHYHLGIRPLLVFKNSTLVDTIQND